MNTDADQHENLHHRLVVDNLATAVLMLDGDLRICFANQAAEMLLAISTRNLLGQAADQVLICPDGFLETHLVHALQTGQPVTEREIILRLPDGRDTNVDCTLIPLPERTGSSGLLIEIQQLDRHLRISREETLLAQQKATRDMVRGMAHEIKNPLGGIRGAAQLLQGELNDPELREYTQVIMAEADRLQNLVDRVLGPNRLPQYRSANVHEVLERVRTLVQAEAGERVNLVRDYDPSIPDMVIDKDQLIQALLNIVRNASRALADNGGNIVLRSRVLRQFTIGNVRHRLVALIEIEDNGPGIPEDLREKIFYPMVSGSGGMGVGLAIAQTLINQHQGLIECRSQPGETVFAVFLPVERKDV